MNTDTHQVQVAPAIASNPAHNIVNAALALAEKRSWEAVRLHDIAAETGMTLDEIRLYFREKEEVADAWFDSADAAMLQDSAHPDFLRARPRERLHRVIMSWLNALAPHRKVTRQIIIGKCEPGHLHVQIPAILRVSRTVQWMREAAHCDAVYWHRALEETALTSIYLTTFIYWLNDNSPDSIRTRRLLDKLLGAAETLALRLPWPLRRAPRRLSSLSRAVN